LVLAVLLGLALALPSGTTAQCGTGSRRTVSWQAAFASVESFSTYLRQARCVPLQRDRMASMPPG
jgi:hypothetical protein